MEQKKEDCLVSCVDAGLGYENRAIIEHLDFSVHRGEYICVVGAVSYTHLTLPTIYSV